MYEPKWPFLLMYRSRNRNTGIPQVDELSTRHLGILGVTASSLGPSNGEVEELPLQCFRW